MRIATVLMAMLFAITTQQSEHASALRAAFEAACDRTPEIHALVARRAVVDARQNAAGALLPGGPWSTVTHRTDALTHDRGTRDYMAEFMVPIWLRGERGASLAAALTEGERLEAEIAFRRLEVASAYARPTGWRWRPAIRRSSPSGGAQPQPLSFRTSVVRHALGNLA